MSDGVECVPVEGWDSGVTKQHNTQLNHSRILPLASTMQHEYTHLHFLIEIQVIKCFYGGYWKFYRVMQYCMSGKKGS